MSLATKVLIVERTAAVRDALSALLDAADELQVTAVSANADAALRIIDSASPDIVLVGADLPGAAQLTRRIMSHHPTPVIVLVEPDHVEIGGALLTEGALSVQLRPRDAAAARRFRTVVVALAQVSVVRRRHVSKAPRPVAVREEAGTRPPARIVGVAASTGGPVALQRLFSQLPEELPIPILVVQHIAVGFTAGLVATLQLGNPLQVVLAEDGAPAQPATVYLAPDDRHLAVTRHGRLRLRTDPPVSGFRPSATVLFSSLAAAYGPAAVAVVLTGMGTDGLSGLHEVHAEGGRILAQDESTSVVFGMPGAAVAAGIADVAGPVEALAKHIERFAMTGGHP